MFETLSSAPVMAPGWSSFLNRLLDWMRTVHFLQIRDNAERCTRRVSVIPSPFVPGKSKRDFGIGSLRLEAACLVDRADGAD